MDEIYLREIDRYSLLSIAEEKEIAIRYQKDKNIMDAQRLITCNLRYVVRVANKYCRLNSSINIMELIQEGNLGLIRALESFEPKKGYRLITYADKWIRSYMQKYISKDMNICSGTAKDNYSQHFMRSYIKSKHSCDIDIDSHEETNDNVLLLECTAEETLTEKRWLKSVHEILDDVEGRDKFIVENRLVSYAPMTLKEMGNRLNISQERARQVELALKNNLKKRFEANKGIMEFIRG